MDQAEHRTDFGSWLRRTWGALTRALEALDSSPMEDFLDRVDRLEREVAALKNARG